MPAKPENGWILRTGRLGLGEKPMSFKGVWNDDGSFAVPDGFRPLNCGETCCFGDYTKVYNSKRRIVYWWRVSFDSVGLQIKEGMQIIRPVQVSTVIEPRLMHVKFTDDTFKMHILPHGFRQLSESEQAQPGDFFQVFNLIGCCAYWWEVFTDDIESLKEFKSTIIRQNP